MKIGIVTQPLSRNYGGILQNYALQQTLIKLGHTPYTFDLHIIYTWGDWFRYTIKAIIKKIIGRKSSFIASPSQIKVLEKPLRAFVKKNISLTSPRSRCLQAKQIKKYDLAAIVVGSDQVWRPTFNYRITDMFLEFATSYNIIKIAYAASFGTDDWEYDKQQTSMCKSLVQKFNAVSVREKSGVNLCNHYLNVDAKHVLDPTLLLSADDYSRIITDIPVNDRKFLFAYILDSNEQKLNIINDTATKQGIPAIIKGADNEVADEDSIEQWLAYFRDADYIITDSFHGSVFSIIFNKPFVSIGNKQRGMSRFNSLLSMFELENYLIDSTTPSAPIIPAPDWEKVNAKINIYRKESIRFLSDNL